MLLLTGDIDIGYPLSRTIFRSHDIIKTITNLRARGQEFLNIPDSYYEMLRKRLAKSKVKVENKTFEVWSKTNIDNNNFEGQGRLGIAAKTEDFD